MRLFHLAMAVLTIPAMAAAIAVGGRAVQRGESGVTVDQIEASVEATPEAPPTSAIPGPQPLKPTAHSRAIDPAAVVPPQLPAEELERVEPRAPLSDLSLAGPPKPPKPKMPDDWNGTKLFQPVATAAGLIEAKGYSVAVSGIDVVKQDEICTDDGKSWACGIRARTAFRAFLRGRTVVCTVPPEGGRDLISAECRIGKQDIGQWLVENGWARAARGGPYVEAGEKASTAKKGIFGSAPDLSGLPPVPAASRPAPAAPGSILEEEGGVLRPLADQPAPAE
ncbi:thermonuclease family protein [Mesorhizobium sp. M00.F.Ca.ET.216.01.1.1]|uniref:thermonuclease family protein n=1 Tax=Mesorhizobium sp. M00.F.Ca.ET.216.01.1.1 TaxID=2500528 RepID=UPI001FDFB01D|nr:thermonuclease family protein [Mesorhizobium sp. M00.F.Ca.ET.216.01.1.1]